MSPRPYQQSAAVLDPGPRYYRTPTVAGSPAAAAETIIATLTVTEDLATTKGIRVSGFAAFTIGTDGVSYNLRLRKTDVSGTILKATGVLELAATKLGAAMILGFDTAPTLPNQVYVLTMIVALGSAPSTVSAVELDALVI